MATETKPEVIELRVDDVAQLFHTLDPFPFREKDLDREAEDYIVGWARELPAHHAISIVIDFPDTQAQRKTGATSPKPSPAISPTAPAPSSAISTNCFASAGFRWPLASPFSLAA